MRGNETWIRSGRSEFGMQKRSEVPFSETFFSDSRNSSCPGRSPAEINVSIDPCGCAIPRMDLLAKLIRFAFLHQVHGAAAESPARHPRSITTGEFRGKFDQ